jgi:CRISPR-associated protein Cas2
MLVVIAYDVRNARSRAAISNCLEDFGVRVQKSVFECELTWRALRSVLERVRPRLGRTDSFRCYPLCGGCARRLWGASGLSIPERSGQPSAFWGITVTT